MYWKMDGNLSPRETKYAYIVTYWYIFTDFQGDQWNIPPVQSTPVSFCCSPYYHEERFAVMFIANYLDLHKNHFHEQNNLTDKGLYQRMSNVFTVQVRLWKLYSPIFPVKEGWSKCSWTGAIKLILCKIEFQILHFSYKAILYIIAKYQFICMNENKDIDFLECACCVYLV